jgi:AcrR family transcriptional regulator
VASKKRKNNEGMKNSRADQSRRRILTAARRIFAKYPYGAASVRKIEEEGGFNYALIRYYFGSKKGLFEAVSFELINEYIRHVLPVIRDSLDNTDPETALPRFVNELFEFAFAHPDGPATIMLNIGQPQLFEDTLLGLSAMRRYFSQVIDNFKASIPFEASDREITMWVFAFTVLTANFIGARAFHAAALGLDPEGTEYRQWVSQAVLNLFTPVMEHFLYGPGIDPEIVISEEARAYLPESAPRQTPLKKKKTKGDLTREKILDAAESVFSRRPYNTASIRRIGQEGGFDFTIIHHYFPTKKELAEAVSMRFYDDFFRQSAFWLSLIPDGMLNRVSLSQGLSIYINSLLEYLFSHHHGPAMMMQNIALPDPKRTLPAFDFSLRFYADIADRLKHLLPIKSRETEIRMWQYCLVTLISTCVGASEYPARIIDLSPGGRHYRKWIERALIFLFYPGLKKMITASTEPRPG